jgi:FecR protein
MDRSPKKLMLPTVLGVFTVALISAYAFAAPAGSTDLNPIGVVLSMQSNIVATSTDRISRRLKLKSVIFEGDVIVTADPDFIQLMLKDNSTVNIGGGAKLTLKEFIFHPGLEVRKAIFELQQGRIRTLVTGHFEGDSTYEINTPLGVAGVIGSEIIVEHRRGRTVIVNLRGKIYGRRVNSTININVPEGHRLVFDEMGIPSRPEKLDEKTLRRLISSTTFGGDPDINPIDEPPLAPEPEDPEIPIDIPETVDEIVEEDLQQIDDKKTDELSPTLPQGR